VEIGHFQVNLARNQTEKVQIEHYYPLAIPIPDELVKIENDIFYFLDHLNPIFLVSFLLLDFT